MATTIQPTVNVQWSEITSSGPGNAGGGVWLRQVKIPLTNLAAGTQYQVQHGLTEPGQGAPVTPLQVNIEPQSNGMFFEYAPADSTYIYLQVGASTGTHACTLYVVA